MTLARRAKVKSDVIGVEGREEGRKGGREGEKEEKRGRQRVELVGGASPNVLLQQPARTGNNPVIRCIPFLDPG